MDQNYIALVTKYVQQIKLFIDKDEPITLLNPSDSSQDELAADYLKCLNYNNIIMTHKGKLDFVMSKLLELKLQFTPNNEQGARSLKQLNMQLDYISQLQLAIEDLRMKYKYNIEYYTWCLR